MTQQYPPPHGQPDPGQWQGYGQQPPPPPPKKSSHGKLGALALLGVGLFVACAVTGQSGTSRPATPTTPALNTATPAQAAPQQAAPAPAGPQTTFSSGTYEVGTDIAPGKYKTTGPEGGSGLCYWARLKNTNGDLDSIIANGNPQGPAVVTISKSDAAFETNGCTWAKSA